MIEKMVAILSKFTVLCLSSNFVVCFFKLRLILFYNRVIYYNARIFLKLLSIYIYIYIYHHHHVVPLARISLTLSRHFSLSSIASGRSSGLHPVSSHICCMYGHPAFAWPYAGVHRSTSLMSSSLLLQQCPACLVRLTWIVFVMGGQVAV